MAKRSNSIFEITAFKESGNKGAGNHRSRQKKYHRKYNFNSSKRLPKLNDFQIQSIEDMTLFDSAACSKKSQVSGRENYFVPRQLQGDVPGLITNCEVKRSTAESLTTSIDLGPRKKALNASDSGLRLSSRSGQSGSFSTDNKRPIRGRRGEPEESQLVEYIRQKQDPREAAHQASHSGLTRKVDQTQSTRQP